MQLRQDCLPQLRPLRVIFHPELTARNRAEITAFSLNWKGETMKTMLFTPLLLGLLAAASWADSLPPAQPSPVRSANLSNPLRPALLTAPPWSARANAPSAFARQSIAGLAGGAKTGPDARSTAVVASYIGERGPNHR